jgi:hypothetical protein
LGVDAATSPSTLLFAGLIDISFFIGYIYVISQVSCAPNTSAPPSTVPLVVTI